MPKADYFDAHDSPFDASWIFDLDDAKYTRGDGIVDRSDVPMTEVHTSRVGRVSFVQFPILPSLKSVL